MNHLLSLPKGTNRMILDTDTANEIDDQFALAWTLLSKDKIDLVGVTAEPYSFQHHRDDLLKTENILNTNKIIFDNLFVFIYSKRPGTLSEKLYPKIPLFIKKKRIIILNNINLALAARLPTCSPVA